MSAWSPSMMQRRTRRTMNSLVAAPGIQLGRAGIEVGERPENTTCTITGLSRPKIRNTWTARSRSAGII
jgi:hypothetical protein